MTEETAPVKKEGLFWQLLGYIGSYFDILKSRTNGVVVAGVVAYFASKLNISVDSEVLGGAIADAATQVGTVPLTVQDLIVFAVAIAAVYFRSNPKAKF